MTASDPARPLPGLKSLPTLDECVHCGLCLGSCPTYELFGREVESPRGRISALRNLSDGEPLTPAVADGLDDCLVCRSCESACPSGISMERMMSHYRATVRKTSPRWRDRLERWFLREVVPRPAALRVLTVLTRITRPLLWATGFEVPRAARLKRRPYRIEQPSRSRGRVRIFRGCITDVWFRQETQAAIDVLTRNGWSVELGEEGCCGALHRHAGYLEEAESLERSTASTLESGDVDFIVSDTAGCSAALLEPLENDGASIGIGAKLTDTMGLLHHQGYSAPPRRLEGAWRVAPPCHHRHGELDEEPTQAILETIVEGGYSELPGPDHCCGAAGLYLLRNASVSRRIGAAALSRYESTMPWNSAPHSNGASTGIIAGNAGCLLRWETLLESHGAEAIHPVVALDRAYRAGPSG